jgi:Cytochrome c554 and c-prime
MNSRFASGILIGASLFVAHAEPRSAPRMKSSRTSVPVVQQGTDRQDFVGDEACRACHAEKVESYFHTAHHIASRLPTRESILGSFDRSKNVLKTSNPGLYFRMESRADGFYQIAISESPQLASIHSERIDIVIGSGRSGQTYLDWKNDRLFQLPVSYWTDLDAWVNSPGYRDGTANFARPVLPRCIECHITYLGPIPSPPAENQFKPASLVLGISCERCHGPGRQHAETMSAKNSPSGIVNPAKLPRDRQIEVCAQCHGGRRLPLLPVFSYRPGEPLDKYSLPLPRDAALAADVHGNQVGLLRMSRCYQSAAEMTCTTCHDVHQVQRDPAAFSAFCVKCHQPQSCGEFSKLREKIIGTCVNCHMPLQPSNLIITSLNGKQSRPMLRSHWIKIYPDLRAP